MIGIDSECHITTQTTFYSLRSASRSPSLSLASPPWLSIPQALASLVPVLALPPSTLNSSTSSFASPVNLPIPLPQSPNLHFRTPQLRSYRLLKHLITCLWRTLRRAKPVTACSVMSSSAYFNMASEAVRRPGMLATRTLLPQAEVSREWPWWMLLGGVDG
jgi:hypothetical protein